MNENARIAKLEEALAHQQHFVEQLNEIVIRLRDDVEKLQRHAQQQKTQIKTLEGQVGEEIPSEKPPHY